MHATNSEKVLVTTSTKESAVLETHLPHKKQETTLMNAYKLGGGTLTTSADESVCLETLLL